MITSESEFLIYTDPKHNDSFRDRRSLKTTIDRGIISQKKETRTGDFVVQTKSPNAHRLTTDSNFLLRDFLAAAILSRGGVEGGYWSSVPLLVVVEN